MSTEDVCQNQCFFYGYGLDKIIGSAWWLAK